MEEIGKLQWKFRDEHISYFTRLFQIWHQNPLIRDYYISHNIFDNIRNQTKMEIEQNDN